MSFVIGLHCSSKKSLNRFALTKRSVINSLFTRRGGISGIFEPLANVFGPATERSYKIGVVGNN